MFHLPAIPPGAAEALRLAADETREALEPAGAITAKSKLVGLRSSTQLRRELVNETEATIDIMALDLAHVPADILAKALRDYRVKPGARFFPRAAGEVMEFVAPLLAFRRRAADRLARMARAADEADRERARLAADPLTPEAAAAIKAQYGLVDEQRRSGRIVAKPTASPRIPTPADYEALGLQAAPAPSSAPDPVEIAAEIAWAAEGTGAADLAELLMGDRKAA